MHAHDLSVPSDDTAHEAEVAVRLLSDRHAAVDAVLRVRGQADAEPVEVSIPAEARDLLVRILAYLADGDAVTVLPVHAELTTQEAAELLRVSRPHLIKLLEEGEIPFRKVGTHRRVALKDVLEFDRKDRERRMQIADELSRDAQELGLDY